MDRSKILMNHGAVVGMAIIAAMGILIALWLMSSPENGADVTDTQYNGGYVRNRIYTTVKPLGVYRTPPGVPVPVTQYRLEDLPSSKYASINSGLHYVLLPAGSRVRFNKMLWFRGHPSWNGTGGPTVIAYGTVLDGPCAGRVVDLAYVSKRYDLAGKCMPCPAMLR